MVHSTVRVRHVPALLLAVTLIATTATTPSGATGDGEWRTYAGTNAGLKYSTLDQITRSNVGRLTIAWRQSAVPLEIRRGRASVALPTNYQATPIMVDGLLYMAAGDGSIVALNPGTGAVVWSYVSPDMQPAEPAEANQPAKEVWPGSRRSAAWRTGPMARTRA